MDRLVWLFTGEKIQHDVFDDANPPTELQAFVW